MFYQEKSKFTAFKGSAAARGTALNAKVNKLPKLIGIQPLDN